MTRLPHALLVLVALAGAACHPEPVLQTGARPQVDGTIAGVVTTAAKSPVVGRKVTAVNTASGMRFEGTTGANGGYTIQVPQGAYRIEIELQTGEKLLKQPGETRINRSDLDANRDFVIGGSGGR